MGTILTAAYLHENDGAGTGSLSAGRVVVRK